MQAHYGPVAPKFVVLTAKHDVLNTCYIQGVCTHDTGLYSHIEGTVFQQIFLPLLANLSDAIYLAMRGCLV